ncbi:MAG: hypothetical protein VB025_14635 [Sphaerochaeta sp.]|nr:hypothetical protein [Sphaerochaeta sp.]
MKELKVKIIFAEDVLGTASANEQLHDTYIASKAPDAPSREEEVEALGIEAVVENGMTVFPRELVEGKSVPILWDYQIKGFFKDAAGMLKKVSGTKSSAIKAHKKAIDGLLFVEPRRIPISLSGKMGECQRPLRAQTAQGERIAIAHSETVPAGSSIEITVKCLDESLVPAVQEWLDYGSLRGIGQWRNSGKGRFSYEVV